ncbi:MAG: hypothetical protein HQL52_12170 [Magnetococcales bacterium]|nr:hypothetical protein [Magnetococcales bacterium]
MSLYPPPYRSARFFVMGSLKRILVWVVLFSATLAQAEDIFQVNAVTLDEQTRQHLGSASTTADTSTFFQAQKELVHHILNQIGIPSESLPPEIRDAVNQHHTTSIHALIAFSQGLDHLDNNRYSEAKSAFITATRHDPEFQLATTFHASMPEQAMEVHEIHQAAGSKGQAHAKKILSRVKAINQGSAAKAQKESTTDGEADKSTRVDEGDSDTATKAETTPEQEPGMALAQHLGSATQEETESDPFDILTVKNGLEWLLNTVQTVTEEASSNATGEEMAEITQDIVSEEILHASGTGTYDSAPACTEGAVCGFYTTFLAQYPLISDSDGDGMVDVSEMGDNLPASFVDTDSDGLVDLSEIQTALPAFIDLDEDEVVDFSELTTALWSLVSTPYITTDGINPDGTQQLTIAQDGGIGQLVAEGSDGVVTRITGLVEGSSDNSWSSRDDTDTLPLSRINTGEYEDETGKVALQLGYYSGAFSDSQTNTMVTDDQGFSFFYDWLFFAEGEPTSSENIATLAQNSTDYHYAGRAGADFHTPSDLQYCTSCGTFEATLNFAQSKVSDLEVAIDLASVGEYANPAALNIQAASASLMSDGTFSITPGSDASFQIGASGSLATATNGALAGRTFGLNAAAVGGVFALEEGDYAAAGSFGGSRFGGVGTEVEKR